MTRASIGLSFIFVRNIRMKENFEFWVSTIVISDFHFNFLTYIRAIYFGHSILSFVQFNHSVKFNHVRCFSKVNSTFEFILSN